MTLDGFENKCGDYKAVTWVVSRDSCVLSLVFSVKAKGVLGLGVEGPTFIPCPIFISKTDRS
jgi:hypothetical protein